jgi:hypothetical protein
MSGYSRLDECNVCGSHRCGIVCDTEIEASARLVEKSGYFIPGRKGPQQYAEPEQHEDELVSLLSAPKRMLYKGELTDFYGIGDLARALNRAPVTIRKLEAAGVIPKPSFGSKTAALGGRVRRYTLEQIKAARDIAGEEGILADTTKAINRTQFKGRVKQAWQELKEQG